MIPNRYHPALPPMTGGNTPGRQPIPTAMPNPRGAGGRAMPGPGGPNIPGNPAQPPGVAGDSPPFYMPMVPGGPGLGDYENALRRGRQGGMDPFAGVFGGMGGGGGAGGMNPQQLQAIYQQMNQMGDPRAQQILMMLKVAMAGQQQPGVGQRSMPGAGGMGRMP